MKKRLFYVGVLFCSVVLFTSCASFPQTEYDSTKAVVSEVKTAGADVYVPEVYKTLTDSLEKAEIKLAAEKSKWFRTYKEPKVYLAGVTNFAVEVKGKNEVRKAELVKENEGLVTEVTALITTDTELLTKAPKGKGGAEILVAIRTDVSVVQTTLDEAKVLVTSNDLLGANSKLKAAKEKGLAIKAELETAIAKVTKHKK